MATVYETATDTAKKIRAALKKAFPELPASHFSVRARTYAGGSSVSVNWSDYPSIAAVSAITEKFASASMNLHTDMKDYVGYVGEDGKRYMGADFVHTNKTYTDEHRADIQKVFDAIYGEGTPMTSHTREKLSEAIGDGLYGEHLQPTQTNEIADNFYQDVILLITWDWYYNNYTDEFIKDLVYAESDLSVYTPERFLEDYLPYIITYYGITSWTSSMKQRGFDVPSSVGRKGIRTLAMSPTITELPDTEEQALKSIARMCYSAWEDVMQPTQLTEHDQEMWTFVLNRLSQEGFNTDEPSEEVSRDQLIHIKHPRDVVQVRNYYEYAKQVYQNKKQLPNGLIEQDIQAMNQLREEINLLKASNLNPPGKFTEVSSMPSYLITTGSAGYLICPVGLFRVDKESKEVIAQRDEPGDYSFIRESLPVLMSCMDYITAQEMAQALNRAFGITTN